MRWLKRIRGQFKLIKVALYLYRQGKPWDWENGFTSRQAELLEAAALVLYAKDSY